MENSQPIIRKISGKLPAHRVEIYHLLLMRDIKKSRDTILKKHGLTPPEWLSMAIINEHPAEVTAKDIAQELDANPTYITAALTNLKRKKLITSKTSVDDKRRRVLNVNAAAKTILDTIDREFHSALNDRLKGITKSEVQSYYKILQTLSGTTDAS